MTRRLASWISRLPVSLGLLWALGLGTSGCLHVYQPMAGLHSPVVVDPQQPNLQDVRLTVYCAPGELLNSEEARVLCRRVGRLFENQGASVLTYTRNRRQVEQAREEEAALAAAEAEEGTDASGVSTGTAEAATDLVLELRSRETHKATDPVSWILCAGSFTLVPAISESTFAIDVVIRDGTGFLLGQQTLQGRVVRYFGVGSWATNRIVDLLWREDEDELTGDAVNEDLSADLYRQLSQLVFNAKMQWQVRQEGLTAAGAAAPGAAAPAGTETP